ncbi:MAG: membrane protein insertion efficiency factor YidD [Pseudomonadales bacterium]
MAFFTLLIDGYRLAISPLLGQHCRFHPSCSCYARDALQTHGLTTGLWLAIRRVLRCHPWHAGGLDPVPTPASDQVARGQR